MKKEKNLQFIYSTHQDNLPIEPEEPTLTLEPAKQKLYVELDRKQRAGKEVTIVSNFQGKPEDLEDLGKSLKNKCGVGGSVKEGEIILQGNQVQKLLDLLPKLGYTKVIRKGG
jgi:translation initiation factor 1